MSYKHRNQERYSQTQCPTNTEIRNVNPRQSERKDMFYLMTHSTHYVEGNILFNDTLNTFYLQLYGIGHMVKDHSDSERGNMLPPPGLFFPINNKGSFRVAASDRLYAPSHRQDNTYHSLCYTSRGALAGTRNSSMGPPHEGSIRRPIAP